jgi:hypothetical protein
MAEKVTMGTTETGGRLGGRRHVLMVLISLRGLTAKAKPGNNLRDLSKFRPGLITA